MAIDLSEMIRRWPPAVIARLNADPKVCEDCGNGTDLGHKCRSCYARWSALLWQDIPSHHAELEMVARQLNIIGDGDRKRIADMAMGHGSGRIDGRIAELYAIVKRVIAGPFGPSLEVALQAIRSASEKTTGKTRGARADVED